MTLPYSCWRSFCTNCQTEWTSQYGFVPEPPTCECGLKAGMPHREGRCLMLMPWTKVGNKAPLRGVAKWRHEQFDFRSKKAIVECRR